ncbi:MAG: hypothetical protein M1840_001500 [Geoglossum simile]|nr:MAG: hypothetical protein M1840_001500 [Geoglossum simile]
MYPGETSGGADEKGSSEQQHGKLVLLSNQDRYSPNPLPAAITLPSPSPQSSPQAPTATIAKAVSPGAQQTHRSSNGALFTLEMRPSAKRSGEENGYQGELQAKLRQKVACRDKLDMEIRVLREALDID